MTDFCLLDYDDKVLLIYRHHTYAIKLTNKYEIEKYFQQPPNSPIYVYRKPDDHTIEKMFQYFRTIIYVNLNNINIYMFMNNKWHHLKYSSANENNIFQKI